MARTHYIDGSEALCRRVPSFADMTATEKCVTCKWCLKLLKDLKKALKVN